MRAAVYLFVHALLIGCAADAPDRVPQDEHAPAGTPVEIDPDPSISVGVLEGDPHEEFDDVLTPFLLPDGQLAVPTAGHGEIRLFDAAGQFARAYGGSGEGPGEFGRIGGAWARGDTIEALDLALRRITRFLPFGEPEIIRLNGPYIMWAVGPVSDGWVFLDTVEPGRTRDNPRDQVALYRFDQNGEYVGDVAHVEGIRRIRLPGMVAAEAFSPSARFAAHGGQVYIAETLTPEIKLIDPDGREVRTVAWEPETATLPSDALAEARAALPLPDVTAEQQGMVDALLEAPLPEEIPVFSDILVDTEGFIWVRSYVPARDALVVGATVAVHRRNPGGDWDIFSSDGERLGRVTMPADLEPHQITSDAVVGIVRGDLGIEMVRVYQLIRR